MSGKTYTGQEITVPFTQEGTLKGFEIKGKSVQETRSGINKFDLDKISWNTDKYSRLENGFKVSNAWATSMMGNENLKKTFKPNTAYTVRTKSKLLSKPTTVKENNNHLLVLYRPASHELGTMYTGVATMHNKASAEIGKEYTHITTFTTGADLTGVNLLTYTFYGNNDESTTYAGNGEIEISEIMMVEGTYTLDNFPEYEAYGIAPSPEFPSEIQSVGDDVNLWNLPYIYELNKQQEFIQDIPAGTYTLNAEDITSDYSDKWTTLIVFYYEDGTNKSIYMGGTQSKFTTTTFEKKVVRFIIYSNNSWATSQETTTIFKGFKLQKGTVATPYSEHGKGTVELKRYGKNIFPNSDTFNNLNWTLGGTIDIEESFGSSYAIRTDKAWNGPGLNLKDLYEKGYIKIGDKVVYSIYFKTNFTPIKDMSFTNYRFTSASGNGNNIFKKANVIAGEWYRIEFSFVINEYSITSERARIETDYYDTQDQYYFGNNRTNYIYYARPQLEIRTDGKASEYEPHNENNYVIQTTPLRSLPNEVKDTIEEDGIHKRVGSAVLNGSEKWYTANTDDNYAYFYTNSLDNLIKSPNVYTGYCDKLYSSNAFMLVTTIVDRDTISIGSNGTADIRIKILKSRLNKVSVDGFVAWLQANPLIIQYERAEEVIEPFEEQPQIKVYPGQNTFSLVNNNLETTMLIDTGEIVPVETQEMYALRDAQPNEGTSVSIEIWTHEDEFIDTLYNTDYEFEGQCIDPKITLNANGAKTLTLGLPLYIINKKTQEYIENPRWYYITQQYKIRVKQDENINEFVLKDYTESHDADDHLMININAQSLEEFELSQIGYNITFDENTLYKYNTNDDPNDPDTIPIGVYDADIHFWNEKLLENSEWKYRVESYYPVDKEMTTDNRQKINAELEYKNGPEQFYEEDRIIDYTEDNQPIKADAYEVKKRIVKVSKSNIFNIVQDICEAFECWPTFEIKYENEKIVEKTIVYKNDIPQDAKFSVNYQTNLNSIERIVDSSQIVTKMYVTPISNSNVDNGTITIATNPKNYMKENYLLDLSWYLGENRADTEISNAALINPNIGMTFERSDYTEPQFETTTTTNTKETIETYQKNIRNRNTYIENTSLKLSKDQQELINLKTEKEYVQSQKDSAQEIVNDLVDEISLIGTTELRKENKACYLYSQNGITIIRFSEIGIKSVVYSPF